VEVVEGPHSWLPALGNLESVVMEVGGGMFWLHLYMCVCVLQLTSHAYKRPIVVPPQNKLSMRELNDHFLPAPVSL
jgi:hypothetical protein